MHIPSLLGGALACTLTLSALAQASEVTSGLGPLDFTHDTLWQGENAGVYVIHRPEPMRIPVEANITVIEQAEGLVLVDAGGSPEAGRHILAELAEISDKPITHIIITHWHGDHHFGLGAFVAAYPDVEIIAHENTARYMAGPEVDYRDGQADSFAETPENLTTLMAENDFHPDVVAQYQRLIADAPYLAEAHRDIPKVEASLAFSDSVILDDDVTPVEVRFLGRANTDGDAVIWMARQHIVASGDIVVAPTPFGFGSYYQDWPQTLRALNALDYQILVPGHGAVQHDQAYVDQLIAMMEDVIAQLATLNGQEPTFESDEALLAAVNWDQWRMAFAKTDPWLITRFNNWFATPAGAYGLKTVRGEEIIQGEE